MIVANALKSIIDQKTVQVTSNNSLVTTAINFHYGDQKELLKWVKLKNNAKQVKYPLVWYILGEYTKLDGFYETEVTIAVMQLNDDINDLNTKRSDKSYLGIIIPVWDKVESLLFESGKIEVFGNMRDRFKFKDEPNFGVDIDYEKYRGSDFKSSAQKGTQSIVTDIVDATFVNFKMRINLNNC